MSSPQPHPIAELGWIRGAYYAHLREWLYSQIKRWEAPMLASKVGLDIEAQLVSQRRTFDLANLMRAVVSLHAEMVHKGFSLTCDALNVWRDVLANANPRFVEMRPQLKALYDDPHATQVDFLAEFDRFVMEERLNDKTVVLMNCPESLRWNLQDI